MRLLGPLLHQFERVESVLVLAARFLKLSFHSLAHRGTGFNASPLRVWTVKTKGAMWMWHDEKFTRINLV
jgi:hypothetical protein